MKLIDKFNQREKVMSSVKLQKYYYKIRKTTKDNQ